ncbi:MAG TPA: ABC transporter permease [Acidobacteriaceae bacterium]|jgi:predicted permease|nr:ABC transporter permease [Acidobacteriaceae bacterium]
MLADLKYAWRQLRKSPGFALTAVITLALGIGATTAIFTMFDQVLLRMLPVEKPQELVRFEWTGSFSGSASSFGGGTRNYYSYPMYKDLRDHNSVFSGMLAADRTNLGLSWHNQAESVRAELVSGNYFQVLGLKPAVGQLFTAADETANGANPVAVLSYDEWRTHFGADRSVIGKAVAINGNPFTIVGVAPENFHTAIGGYRPALFVPVTMVDTAMPWMAPRHNFDNRQSLWLTIVARRKPGVSMAQAQAAMLPLWRALRASELPLYKEKTAKFVERYVNGSNFMVKDDSMGFSPGRMDLKTPLVILLSMAGLLMAMCGLNVATLLLLRSTARVKEMAMRYALGAKSSRIVRQLLLEGGLLGLVGGAAGLALSPVLAQMLVRLLTSAEPGTEPYSASLDGRVLAFALGLSVLVSVLFSIAPALHFLRPDLAGSLRQSTGTASKASQGFRKLAVGVQIALSVLLLGGAGLFVRTLNNLRDVPVGWDTAHVDTFQLEPSASGYSEQRTSEIVKAAVERLQPLPGVAAVSATTDAELSGDSNTDGYQVQGHKFTENERSDFESPFVMPGYFATLRQPLLVGRDFTDGDKAGAPKVAVVNLEFAKRFYGSAANALGRLIGDGDKPDTTIVGVVGDTRHTDLRTDTGPEVYQAYLQMQHPTGVDVYLRTLGAPDAMEPEIERAVHQLDPTLVVDGLRTMEAQVDMSASNERALAILAAAFAVLAAMLAAVGLYGVLAYSTQSRTREIGVRLALGSPRGAVVALVVREMAWIAGGAALVALPATVGLAHFFRSQLYDVSTWDPVTLTGALLLTAVMVALASALPARRATRVDPMVALRSE